MCVCRDGATLSTLLKTNMNDMGRLGTTTVFIPGHEKGYWMLFSVEAVVIRGRKTGQVGEIIRG